MKHHALVRHAELADVLAEPLPEQRTLAPFAVRLERREQTLAGDGLGVLNEAERDQIGMDGNPATG
jgi:hypothetical protein